MGILSKQGEKERWTQPSWQLFKKAQHLVVSNFHNFPTQFSNIASKGISSNLMKASSVRRRTKAQIRADKAEEERKELETKTKLARFAEMEQQLAQVQ